MAVTQKDIAQTIGIDRSMVAHALRGDSRVAEATRERVLEVAREMGYNGFSNNSARAMASRRHGRHNRAGTIAVLMGDVFEGIALFDVPFFREIMTGMKRGAHELDVEITISMSSGGRLPRFVHEDSVDGALCIYSDDMNELLRRNPLPVPTLRVGMAAQGESAVLSDNRQGIALATHHLIEAGHRHGIGLNCVHRLQ